MRLSLAILVLASVLMSAGSQVILKFGMTSPAVKDALGANNGIVSLFLAIATSPWVLGGFFCFFLSAVVWLFVLLKIPLSSAYPFVALGIAITVTAGRFVFHEPISFAKVCGIGLVIA